MGFFGEIAVFKLMTHSFQPGGPRCNMEWIERKQPGQSLEAPETGPWNAVDPEGKWR